MAEAKEGRRIADAGEKIGGARKDWRFRALGLDDLEGMTNEEALGAVKKDNVWPQPDWRAAVDGGMDPVAAALAKVVRDRMAQSPTFRRRASDAAAVRSGFVATVEAIRDLATACRTVEDVKGLYGAHVASLGGTSAVRSMDDEGRDAFFSVYKGKYAPHQVDSNDMRKAEAMVADGFPDKVPPWRKGLKTRPETDGTVSLSRDGRVLGWGFASPEAAFEWAREAHASKRTGDPAKKEEPKRPHLDSLERSGLPERREGDVSSDDFIETFGFRGVEFGNWLPDAERQQVINLAYDALHDLAEALDWDLRALSLHGTLAVAFGSRGSGSFAAHYEPARKVINMTRLSGAGSLAHEYAHAIDHWSGEVAAEGASREVRSGTGWYARPANRLAHLLTLPNLPPEAAASWEATVSGLYKREHTREEAIAKSEALIAKRAEELGKARAALAQHLERPPERQVRKWVKDMGNWIAGEERFLESHRARHARVVDGDPAMALGNTQTDYAGQARALCGKSGEYYVRPTEMFARAFESMVFDRLGHMGAKSDYLVHGVEEDRFVGDRYKGNPYPTGTERTAFYDLISRLAGELKPLAEHAPDAGPRPA